ncbi:NAD(P)-binding domain-containing protein [Streptomyces sp. H27-C3]|uniref:NADPH-dependent F420 reductase n=1 Tax=Streptomyces sp. H27-C3 TaxID=3046305 RepID=UPI0024BB1D51|nr:NAD(P)-binding domain-containing protein [Streptomyces sp. H27-C3]MDJ0460936.1 NAD(P)-binding domain-containing protein [Streptomyces sp. H27-C3]
MVPAGLSSVVLINPSRSHQPKQRSAAMRIGILGAGSMADALGTRWAGAGHDVMVGARDAAKAGALAERIGAGAKSGSLRDAADFGGVVLLALPTASVPEALAAAGAAEGALRGKPLIDCTNPLAPGTLTPAPLGGASTAEYIANGTGAGVVKAFNLCAAEVWRMPSPVFGGRPLAVPLCGDEEDALAVVRRLVDDLGCTPVDGGGLAKAGLLEGTAVFVIGLWFGGVDAQAIVPPLESAFGAG